MWSLSVLDLSELTKLTSSNPLLFFLKKMGRLLGWYILQLDTTEQGLRATASEDYWHHAAGKHDAIMANR
jgi:hypothetical protein